MVAKASARSELLSAMLDTQMVSSLHHHTPLLVTNKSQFHQGSFSLKPMFLIFHLARCLSLAKEGQTGWSSLEGDRQICPRISQGTWLGEFYLWPNLLGCDPNVQSTS